MDSYLGEMISLGSHPDKLTINLLTMKASDVQKSSVPGVSVEDVVGAIESRLLRVNPEEKLPLLYLIDSIMHNSKGKYPVKFSKNIAYMFQDAYKEAPNAKNKDSMKRLLGRWVMGDPIGRPTPKSLAKIHKDVFDPNFNEGAFIADQEHKFPLLKQPTVNTCSTRFHPNQHVPQSVYDDMLAKEASHVLSELLDSMEVPRSQHLTLNEIRIDRPELHKQVLDRAKDSLVNVHVRVPTPVPYHHVQEPYHHEQEQQHHHEQDTYVQEPSYQSRRNSPAHFSPPTERFDDWDPKQIAAAPDAAYVALVINHNAVEQSSFRDRNSQLCFRNKEQLGDFQAYRDEMVKKIENLGKSFDGLKARGWFLASESWLEGVSFKMIVDGTGFDDEENEDGAIIEDDEQLQLARQDSQVSVDPRLHAVPEDESQTACPITGLEFKKFWSDEEGQWMFEDAIKPVEDGPIYMASAYFEQNAKRKSESPEISAKKLKI